MLGIRRVAISWAIWFAPCLLFGQGAGPQLTTLCDLIYSGPPNGFAFGPGGAIYGAAGGGISGDGTIVQLAPPPSGTGAWTETIVYEFTDQAGDGRGPNGNLAVGADGTLYGTTVEGGTGEYGTVFELVPPATVGGAWVETVLYRFTGGSDGGWPYAGLAIDSKGVLFGTTYLGTLFALAPPRSAGEWSFSVLSGVSWGLGALTIGPGGTLYGTTFGGEGQSIYDVVPPASEGDTWTWNGLLLLSGNNGSNPIAPLLMASNYTLFAAAGGGPDGAGVVFQLSPDGPPPGEAWTQAILYSFPGTGSNGSQPSSALVLSREGLLYGATSEGGVKNSACKSGCGTIFQLRPPAAPGGNWTEVVVYRFQGGADGSSPYSLMLGSDGNLYGLTLAGGASGDGTLFRLGI